MANLPDIRTYVCPGTETCAFRLGDSCPHNPFVLEAEPREELHTYAAMAHKGKRQGETFEVRAASLLAAKEEAVRIAQVGTRARLRLSDVSVQLQRKADGTEVIGAIM